MKKIEDMWNSIKKNNLTSTILISCFAIFNIIFAYSQFWYEGVGKEKKILVIMFVFFFLIQLVLFNYIKRALKKGMAIEKIFLLTIFIIGFLYLLMIPIGGAPDEKSHFLRIYEISEGHMISDRSETNSGGREVAIEFKEILEMSNTPKYKDVINQFHIVASENKEFHGFAGASLYSPLSYIPQTIGLLLGKIITPSLVLQAYCARIVNFICCALLLFLALKIIPCFKKFFIVCAFMPMIFQQLISLSPDGITLSLAFLFFAYILKLRFKKEEKIKKKDIVILTVIATILSICKIVYLPLCLLAFLIPEEKFIKKKNKYLTIIAIAGWILIVNLFWLSIASTFLIEFSPGVNSGEQILFVLKNPLQYGLIIIKTLSVHSLNYILGIVGNSLEWFSVNLSALYPVITLMILGYVAYQDNDQEKRIDFSTKFVVLIVLAITSLLIFTSLYIQWNVVGNKIIEGVQGRYFIPLLLFIPCLLYNKKRKVENSERFNQFLFQFMLGFNIYALCVVFLSHV